MLAPIFTDEDVAAADAEIERAVERRETAAAAGPAGIDRDLEAALSEALEGFGDGAGDLPAPGMTDGEMAAALEECLAPAVPAATPSPRASFGMVPDFTSPWHAGWMAVAAAVAADMAGAGTWSLGFAPAAALAVLAMLAKAGRASPQAVAGAAATCAAAAALLAWHGLFWPAGIAALAAMGHVAARASARRRDHPAPRRREPAFGGFAS